MNTRNFNQGVHIIIIGSSTDVFINHVEKLAYDYQIDYTLCGDIYLAAGQLSKNNLRKNLVIGRFENLKKEEGWFFQVSGEGKIFCCCLIDLNSAVNHRRLASVKDDGVFIINYEEEVEAVMAKVLASNIKAESTRFIREQFSVTSEEIDALLAEQ